MISGLSVQTLGQYELVKTIGTGGAATVYLARQPSIDRLVAMKVLSPQLSSSDDFRARFEREAKIIARLEHDRIVPIHDFGEDQGHFYLVMRYVESSLHRLIHNGPLPLPLTGQIVQEICKALQYAHDRNVIHRDIKPSNILLNQNNDAFLSDFGLAKLLDLPHVTSPDNMLGTPAYMAPEMWRDEEVGVFTDLYALGVSIFKMLCGATPFKRPTLAALMYDHLEAPPPSLPGISEGVQEVVHKLLAKNPADRYGSALEAAEAFQRAILLSAPDQPTLTSTPTFLVRLEQSDGAVFESVTHHSAALTSDVEPTHVVDHTTRYVSSAQPKQKRRPSILRLAIVAALLLVTLLIVGNGRNATMPSLNADASLHIDAPSIPSRRILLAPSGASQGLVGSPSGAAVDNSGASSQNPSEGQGNGKGSGG